MELKYKIKPQQAKEVFQKVVVIPSMFILFFLSFFINYENFDLQNIMTIALLSVAYFAIYQLLKMLMLPRIEQTELIIKKEGIFTSSTMLSILPFSDGVLWSEGKFEVVDIEDIKNSRFAQMQTNNQTTMLSPDDKLLLVVSSSDRQRLRKPAFIFNTALWQIGGRQEIQALCLFLAELGYPIRTMTSEETEGTYFYQFEDYGKRSDKLAVGLIGLLIVSIILFSIDAYFTLEYGYIAPVLWVVGITSGLLALLWIKTVRRQIWLHIILSAMFAIFFTIFTFTVLINITPFVSTEQSVNFHYNGQQNKWLMEDNPTAWFSCRGGKDTVDNALKSVIVLKSLSMIRVNEDSYCKEINDELVH